jgi:TatD DNase family protein
MYLEQFDSDREECMERALAQDVALTILPNIDSGSIEPIKNMMSKWPDQVKGMMGLHPCSVDENFEKELSIIKKELFSGPYVAVGEIGIDLYWDKSFLKEQMHALKTQIRWAKELSLPIVLHVRDSFNEVFEVLDAEGTENLTGVFHCFTGNDDQAAKALSYEGFYLGLGGVLTFKNSALPEVIKKVPLSRIVLETDAPYLSPVPHRGKRNETSYTRAVAEKLAQIFDSNIDTIAHETTKNAKRLFKL